MREVTTVVHTKALMDAGKINVDLNAGRMAGAILAKLNVDWAGRGLRLKLRNADLTSDVQVIFYEESTKCKIIVNVPDGVDVQANQIKESIL